MTESAELAERLVVGFLSVCDQWGVVKGGGTWAPLDPTRPVFTKGCKKQGFEAKRLVHTSKNIVKYKVLGRFGSKAPSKKAQNDSLKMQNLTNVSGNLIKGCSRKLVFY